MESAKTESEIRQELEKMQHELDALKAKYVLSVQRSLMYEKLLTSYIMESSCRSRANADFDINGVLQEASTIMLNRDLQPLTDEQGVVELFLQCMTDAKITSFPYRTEVLDFDVAVIFGVKEAYEDSRMIFTAEAEEKPAIFIETGFLLSVLPTSKTQSPIKYRMLHSMVMDRKGMYFDARHPSDLEDLLNSSFTLSQSEIQRARQLINKIVSNKISKYNHQPIRQIENNDNRKRVLVIDQVWGDASITYGLANDATFTEMLADAIRENPDAEILIKTHPDTNASKKRRHYDFEHDPLILEHQVRKIDYDLNPYSLLETVDEVYVCTSQLGFEALMCGKRVHTFGMPFYAGWGLTDDRKSCPRRHRQRTLEDVFYMAYIEYSHYVSYETMQPCEIETAMEELLTLRQEYQALQCGTGREARGVPARGV